MLEKNNAGDGYRIVQLAALQLRLMPTERCP